MMKKMMVVALLLTLGAIGAQAQKFALVDMEYILNNIPAYEMANEQISSIAKKWQTEVESVQQDAQNLYKTFQADLVFLSAEMKTKREAEIVAKDQEAQELKRKYFGTDGELFKKRQSLISPIHDDIYNAIKDISEKQGYTMVIDRSSQMSSIIYATPKIDISDEVLSKLKISK